MKNWKVIAGVGAALLALALILVLTWPKSEAQKQRERDAELDALIRKGEERQRKGLEMLEKHKQEAERK